MDHTDCGYKFTERLVSAPGALGRVVYGVRTYKLNGVLHENVEVAVKIVTPAQTDMATLKEYDFWEEMRHPTVCLLLGLEIFWYAPEGHFVMELGETSLEHAIHGCAPDAPYTVASNPGISFDSPHKACAILGVACCLVLTHYRDFIHRDVKPPNIFLDRELFVKVTDFGLAIAAEHEAKSGGSRDEGVLGAGEVR
jgi:serine/threonine protein kinase